MFWPYANNKGADLPAHPRSLISTFVVRYLDSIIPLVSIASVAEKAGLSLPWSQTPQIGFLVTWLNYENKRRRSACNGISAVVVCSQIPTCELQHDKTNKMTCAPSENSDQPRHPPSLISLRCLHEEALGPQLPIECTSFCWFCRAKAHV